jgi:tRNA-(ms[2]io[6]A)-hydroxylase
MTTLEPRYQKLLQPISQFLACDTPIEWVQEAVKPHNLSIILLDHLTCELKAAQSAMFLIRKYAVDRDSGVALLDWLKPFVDFIYRKEDNWRELLHKNCLTKAISPKSGTAYGQGLIDRMILLIKEELHHFCQVLEIMELYDIPYENIRASRYTKGLLAHVTTHEPETLIDRLICGAFIEARSCERFACLAPHVDKRLSDFYLSLLRSEARHYEDYLTLAQQVAGYDISERIRFFGDRESELILSVDDNFKFHSGVPKII